MGVRYKDWSEPPIGTQVRYILEGRGMTNWVGEVVGVPYTQPGRYEHRNLVKVKFGGKPTPRACYVSNLERIEEVASNLYTENLIGPKPEPVKDPKFVAPFQAKGPNVVDSNGRVVTKIQFGGHLVGQIVADLSMQERYDLAKIFAEALNEKYAKKSDAPSPF